MCTGLLTQEAAPGGTVTYTFTASSPGTHAYYSGTQGDLQIEMGLYGAIIVLPGQRSRRPAPPGCAARKPAGESVLGRNGFPAGALLPTTIRKTCYDREYLFQWAEMDPNIHKQALAQVTARRAARPELRDAV